jgi:phosphate uptake regulator
MKRKLIQHGLSSLTLSLPRKWVVANGLKKGVEVEVDEVKGGIIISLEKSYQKKKIELDVSGANPMIRRMIGAAFKSGYDEIDIFFSSFEELKAIQELVREQFTGFEIVNQSRDRIVVKNLSKDSFEQFDEVLRRFFSIVNNISSESASALERGEVDWLKGTALLKIESDKCADYLRRAINRGADTGFERAAPLYTIIEQLEKVVDRYRDMCLLASTSMKKLNKDISLAAKDMSAFEHDFAHLFYKYSVKDMVAFGKNRISLQEKLEKLEVRCSSLELRLVILLGQILNIIFDLNGPLMAIRN